MSDTQLKQYLLDQSLAVRTNVLPEVKKLIDTVIPDYSSVVSYKTNIIDWLKPVIDLTGFFVYPTNGITEGLNWWSGTSKYNIWRDQGDYQWVDNINGRMFPTTIYQSVPSAIDGNFKDVFNHAPVALDLAYVGSTKIQKINIDNNVEFVFYSLSKSFGIRNIRTGWLFTRTPDPKLEALTHSAKYYNYYAHNVSETIIKNFDIDYIHTQLYETQVDVCSRLDLTPSDSVWLATTTDPFYKKFRRSGNIARLCLAGVYHQC